MRVRELIEQLQALNPSALVQISSCCFPHSPPAIEEDGDDLVVIGQAEARSYLGTYDD